MLPPKKPHPPNKTSPSSNAPNGCQKTEFGQVSGCAPALHPVHRTLMLKSQPHTTSGEELKPQVTVISVVHPASLSTRKKVSLRIQHHHPPHLSFPSPVSLRLPCGHSSANSINLTWKVLYLDGCSEHTMLHRHQIP